MDTVLEKIRSVVLGTLAMLIVLLVILMLLNVGKASVTTTTSHTNYDSANAVTVALSAMAAEANAAVDASIQTTHDALDAFGAAIVSGTVMIGRTIATSVMLTLHAIWQNILFAVRLVGSCNLALIKGIGSGFVYTRQAASMGFGLLGDAPSVNAMIRPGSAATLPTIDTALSASYTITQPTEAPAAPATPSSIWPLHGAITTHFGVPHRPYQPIHTGMDISSGNRSGVMPIKPFRAGVVIEAVHTRYGLGNHVVVDHGEGMTSTYAHLYSIAVHVGQPVGTDTALGQEGSTGVSTGTHLHFEIRKDGQLQNPQDYIAGTP